MKAIPINVRAVIVGGPHCGTRFVVVADHQPNTGDLLGTPPRRVSMHHSGADVLYDLDESGQSSDGRTVYRYPTPKEATP